MKIYILLLPYTAFHQLYISFISHNEVCWFVFGSRLLCLSIQTGYIRWTCTLCNVAFTFIHPDYQSHVFHKKAIAESCCYYVFGKQLLAACEVTWYGCFQKFVSAIRMKFPLLPWGSLQMRVTSAMPHCSFCSKPHLSMLLSNSAVTCVKWV